MRNYLLSFFCLSIAISILWLSHEWIAESHFRPISATAPISATKVSIESTVTPISGPQSTKEQHQSPLIVHLVPHSHCDAAYKKTVDEYYETEVRHVLNSVVLALKRDEKRTFLWSETVFLTRWWKDKRTKREYQELFRDFVNQGRVELVNGGWVMHDEAITRYDSQIHQMTYGHDLLQQLFPMRNVSIRTGWQIDPFGPSSFTVNLMAWSGMDLLITNRLPRDLKKQFKSNQTLEFYWTTPETKILVHVLDTHYESIFDWESIEHPSTPVTSANVQEKSDGFMEIIRERATCYISNQILVPMGGDFRFQNASLQFENMERIMKFVHDHPERYYGHSLRFSTVTQYKQAFLASLALQNKSSLPEISGSPFVSSLAGYLFQIPNLKQMVRVCEAVLRTCEVRLFQALRQDSASENWNWLYGMMTRLRRARETVGLMQHHDALPATSYRFVLADYMKRLASSYNDMDDIMLKLLKGPGKDLESNSPWSKGHIIGGGPYLHETLLVRNTQNARSVSLDSILDPQMGAFEGIPLVVINSLHRQVDTVVHLVCTRPDVAIVVENEDGTFQTVMSQATPLEHDIDSANFGLFLISFRSSVPPFGKAGYTLAVCDLTSTTDRHPPPRIPSLDCACQAEELSNEHILRDGISSSLVRVHFDSLTNDISAFSRYHEYKATSTVALNHDIVCYNGQNDTIYSFSTGVEYSNPPPLLGSKKRQFVNAFQGPIFSEVTLELTPWLSVRYRVLNATQSRRGDLDSLLQVSMITSKPIAPEINIASRFKTDLISTDWFYDENGFQPILATYNASNGVGDLNTRPMVSRSWMVERERNERNESSSKHFAVFSTDPRGVVSHSDGVLDVFWMRRNNNTKAWWDNDNADWFKQGQDCSTVRTSVWLSLDSQKKDTASEGPSPRQIASMLANDVVMVKMGPGEKTVQDIPFSKTLPSQLHIVSLRLSGVDKALERADEEAWVDVQVENFSESEDTQVGITILLGNIPRLIMDAASLRSLTYLWTLDDQDERTTSLSRPVLTDRNSSKCSLETMEGGKLWLLSIGARRICSVRVPLEPL
jgi:hypothetical protein